jgi:hypothetical protein
MSKDDWQADAIKISNLTNFNLEQRTIYACLSGDRDEEYKFKLGNPDINSQIINGPTKYNIIF